MGIPLGVPSRDDVAVASGMSLTVVAAAAAARHFGWLPSRAGLAVLIGVAVGGVGLTAATLARRRTAARAEAEAFAEQVFPLFLSPQRKRKERKEKECFALVFYPAQPRWID